MSLRRALPRGRAFRAPLRRIAATTALGLLLLGAGAPALRSPGPAASPPPDLALSLRLAASAADCLPDLVERVETLAAAGRFADACRLAAGSPALLADALALWTLADPPAAARAALALRDPVVRETALRRVAAEWGGGPRASELPAFALALAAPEARRVLLDTGLPRWVEADPAAAARWLRAQPARGAELDSGLAALAIHPDLLLARPALAAEQAERIRDDGLRLTTVSEVVSTWFRLDPAAAAERVALLGSLDDIERAHLRALASDAPSIF